MSNQNSKMHNGHNGEYIGHRGSNYKIPKTYKAEELPREDCKNIIGDEKNKSVSRKKPARSAKKK